MNTSVAFLSYREMHRLFHISVESSRGAAEPRAPVVISTGVFMGLRPISAKIRID
jgi:hypothetical protein